jgi:predicted Zn-dependent peptidase
MLRHTVEEIELTSGAKGLLIDAPDSSVMVTQINFRAGDQYVADPLKWETAHIMEHMSLGANKRYRSSKLFTAEIEKNGAYTNASTGNTEMTYTTECADFEWDRVLDLLCLAVSQPLFLADEFRAEYSNVQEEMLYRSNDHGWRLSLEMSKKFGFNTRTMKDRLELMPNVTVEDVRKHYKDTHFAENMRFVIAGRIAGRKKRIIDMLEAMPLAQKGPNSRLPLPVDTPMQLEETVYIQNDTVPNAYFYIDTYHKKELSRDSLLALGVLNAILVDTWASRIFGTAREKGLIYYLQSGADRNKDYTSWWFGSQISERQLHQFLDLLVAELLRVKKGLLSESELAAAKMYLTGGHMRSAQTVGSLTNGYAGAYYYEDRINDFFTNYPNRVGKVTKDNIIKAAQKMFIDNIWGLGFLGTISEEARLKAEQQVAKLWT